MTAWSQPELEKKLSELLTLDIPYEDISQRQLIAKKTANAREMKPAAVLILFGYREGEPHVLYIRRTDLVETHKGQMAFPGGRWEPEDGAQDSTSANEGFIVTALRETEEEVGISRADVKIFGKLPPLLTVTDYSIQPFVGVLQRPMDQVPLKVDPVETEEALWVPFELLNHPTTYRREHIEVGQARYPIEVYQLKEHRVWGATGTMTKNLLDRLKKFE